MAAIALTTLGVGAALAGSALGAGSATSAAAALSAAKAPVSQLDRKRVVTFRGATITTYQQKVDGVPVLNGQVSVIDGPVSAPTVVGDGTSAQPAAAKVAAAAAPAERIGAPQAIAIAKGATGAAGLRAKPSAKLAFDPKRGLVVRRVVLASSRPMKDFEVLVDAATGQVLRTRNLLQHAVGKARLYTPNPVVWNGGYKGIGRGRKADHNDRDTAKLTKLRVAVKLENLKSGQHCLVGKYVEARLGKSRKGNPVCKSSLDWNKVTRSDNRFEALEAYDQIDQVATYYHDLGFTAGVLGDFHPRRQVIVADAFPDDNSFYSPGDRKIRYGTGGVDDAEDGDVIVHEYGHAIQDAQRPGFGSSDEAGALGEGFGDYQSALNTLLTPGLTPSTHDLTCIFDWDGTGGYGGPGVKPCGRLATGADGTNTYMQARSTCSLGRGREEVHCLGEVWSHGLIDLLRSLPLGTGGVRPISVDVIASQFSYANSESFKQAVNALVAADNALFAGANVTAICNEMKGARGINASTCP